MVVTIWQHHCNIAIWFNGDISVAVAASQEVGFEMLLEAVFVTHGSKIIAESQGRGGGRTQRGRVKVTKMRVNGLKMIK